MQQKFLLLSTLVFLPFVTTSSFLDIYGTWTERLLGNPTANNTHMSTFSSYGQNTSITASLTTPEAKGSVSMQANTRTDKKSNVAGNIHVVAS